MDKAQIWPELRFYRTYEQREKFIYYEERYTEWNIFAVEEGSFHYDLDGDAGTAAFGDLVFCKPGVRLRRVVITPLTFQIFRVRWHKTAGEAIPPDELPISAGKLSIRNAERLAYTYAQLRAAQKLPSAMRDRLQNHYVQDLWLTHVQEAEREPIKSGQGARPANPLMRKAAAAIQERAFEPLSLKTLAAELNMPSYRLSREFKAAFGVTPMQHLSALRLEKAKLLLIETELTLAQIAECCGYETGFYINKLFQKQLGMTPAVFRATHRV